MTKILNHSNESGRSMIEMLGVLAIVGVLTVGGISGYTKAMNKFRMTATMEQVQATVSNVRAAFASEPDYVGLTNAFIIAAQLAPKEMVRGTALVHPFNGNVTLTAAAAGTKTFTVEYANLTRDLCTTLATADFGLSDQNSGLVSVTITGSAAKTYTHTATNNFSTLRPAAAQTDCAKTDGTNKVAWTFM